VRMQGQDLWLLGGGQLQQARIAWNERTGPTLVPVWKTPLDVGEPLHLAQALYDPQFQAAPAVDPDDPTDPDSVEGRAILYLTTQPLDRSGAVVSAVEDATGKILWQTQLGLVAAGAPVLLRPQAGPATLLFQDQAGALHQVPADLAAGPNGWRGLETQLAGSLADNVRWRPRLLALPDGRSAVQVAIPGAQLTLRLVTWDGVKNSWKVETQAFDLAGKSLAGAPVVVAGHLILPLTDGVLYRVAVPFGDKPVLQQGNADWRERFAGSDAPALLAALTGDRFVCGDGERGVVVYEWSGLAGAQPISLPLKRPQVGGRAVPTYTLPRPPAGTPTLVPAGLKSPARLVIADQGSALHSLEVQANGSLKPLQPAWKLEGRATDGPFLVAGRACVVVDEAKLAWLDPETDEPAAWAFKDAGPLVGRPQRPGAALLIATEAGRVLAVDPASGKETARRTLAGSIAPTMSPVPVGESLLLPLTDGTLMLVPGAWLAGPVVP
jgi:hypothetical protein